MTDALKKLLTHLRFSKDDKRLGSLWFVATDDFIQQEALAQEVEQECGENFKVDHFSFAQSASSDFWPLIHRQQSSDPSLILARDLDKLSEDTLKQTFDQLNRGREALASRPVHLVVFLLEPSLKNFILQAGDFWSWRSGYTDMTKRKTPAFEEASYQHLFERYLHWLKQEAFYNERQRMKLLAEFLEEKEVDLYQRKAIDSEGQLSSLEHAIKQDASVFIKAPIGYYKSREFLQHFEAVISDESIHYKDCIPVAIDFEKINQDQPLFSEANLKIIFGPYAVFFGLARSSFYFFGHQVEHLDEDVQVSFVQEVQGLASQGTGSKALMVGMEELLQPASPESFQVYQIAPVPYFWLTDLIEERYGLDYRFMVDFHEPLMKLENLVILLLDPNPIPGSLINAINSYYLPDPNDYLNREVKIYPYKNPHRFSTRFLLYGYEGIEELKPRRIIKEVRVVRGKLIKLNQFKELPDITFSEIEDTVEGEVIYNKVVKTTHILFFIIMQLRWRIVDKAPTKKIRITLSSFILYFHERLRKSDFKSNSISLAIITILINYSHYSYLKSEMLINSPFSKWFKNLKVAKLTQGEKTFLISYLHRSKLVPLYKEYFKSLLEEASKSHPDPEMRELSAKALKQPPLPGHAKLDMPEDFQDSL
jgi:hypothetical protein